MNATLHEDTLESLEALAMIPEARHVGPAEFQALMISHRRMERITDLDIRYKGLRDLETGEVFVVERRRLMEKNIR